MAEEAVQIEKLSNEESFQIWNFQLTVVLKANGIYEIVSGESILDNMRNDEEKNAWKRKDAKAQKLIVTSIDKKWMLQIINCQYAREMYEKLKNIFEKNTQDQVCNLFQQFYNFTFDKASDMTVHLSKIENLAHRLKTLNQNIDDNMVISKILSTLPAEYRHFVTAWESTSVSERTLTNLVARLLSEEDRTKDKEGEAVAFRSEEKFCYKCKNKTHHTKDCKTKIDKKCFKCGKSGHFANKCFRSGPVSCSICKKNNHKETDCFFRKNKQGQNGRTEEGRKVAFFTQNENESNKMNFGFIVDSGSSSHMTNEKNLFHGMEETKTDVNVVKKIKPCELKEKEKSKVILVS